MQHICTTLIFSTVQPHSLVVVKCKHVLTNMLCNLRSCKCKNDLPVFALLTNFFKNNCIHSSGILRTNKYEATHIHVWICTIEQCQDWGLIRYGTCLFLQATSRMWIIPLNSRTSGFWEANIDNGSTIVTFTLCLIIVGLSHGWREGIIVNKRTSHSSNVKSLKYCAVWRLLILVDLTT